jgi:hypothetical protein
MSTFSDTSFPMLELSKEAYKILLNKVKAVIYVFEFDLDEPRHEEIEAKILFLKRKCEMLELMIKQVDHELDKYSEVT